MIRILRSIRRISLAWIGATLLALSVTTPLVVAAEDGDRTFYATALKALPANTLLTPSNVKITKVINNDKMPANVIWLTEPDQAFGFALVRAVKLNAGISGEDLIARKSTDVTVQSTDPQWLKYAKSAIVCDKRNDFPLSRKYELGLLAELNKMADKHQRLTYMDQADWISDALDHAKEHEKEMSDGATDSNKMKAEYAAFNAKNRIDFLNRDVKSIEARENQLKAEQNKLLADGANKHKEAYARCQRIYAAISRVLPANSQLVRSSKVDLEESKKALSDP